MANTYNSIHLDSTTFATSLDSAAVELGVKFSSSVPGSIFGAKLYRVSQSHTANHTVTLWSSTGTKLATATSTGTEATGWVYIYFASPVPITAGTTYVVSYWEQWTSGNSGTAYGSTGGVYNSAVTRTPLTAPKSAGVYDYYTTPSKAMPASTYNGSDYSADPLFAQDAPGEGDFGGFGGGGSLSTSNPATIDAAGVFGGLAAVATASFIDLASDASSFGTLASSASASSTNAGTAAGLFGALVGSASLTKTDPATEAAAFGTLASSASLSALNTGTGTGAFQALTSAASVTAGNGFVAVGQFGSLADSAAFSALNSGTGTAAFGQIVSVASVAATDPVIDASAFGALAASASASATNAASASVPFGAVASAATLTDTNMGTGAGAFGALAAFAQDTSAAGRQVIGRHLMRRTSPLQAPPPDWRVEVDWNHPLAAGLIGCYVPSQSGSDALRNLAGLGGDIPPINSPSLVADPYGVAAYAGMVGATGNGWNVIAPPVLRPAQQVSLLWYGGAVDPTPPTGNPTLFGVGSGNGGVPYLCYALDIDTTSGTVRLGFNRGGSFFPGANSIAMAQGSYHKLVGVLDLIGGKSGIYADGTYYAGSSTTGAITYYSGSDLIVGGEPTRASGTNTLIGAIWNRVLSAQEAAWLSAEPFAMLRPVARRTLVVSGVSTSATGAAVFGALSASATAGNSNAATASAAFGSLTASASFAPVNVAGEASTFGVLAASASASATNTATESGAFPALGVDASADIGNGFIATGRFGALASSAAASAVNHATGTAAFGAATGSGVTASADAAQEAASFGALAASGTLGSGNAASASVAIGALTGSAILAQPDDAHTSGLLPALAAAASLSATNHGQAAASFAPVASSAVLVSGATAYEAGTFGALIASSQIVVSDPVAAAAAFPALAANGAALSDTVASGAFPSLAADALVAMLNPASGDAALGRLAIQARADVGAFDLIGLFPPFAASVGLDIHYPAIAATVLVAAPRRSITVPLV